MLGLIDDPIAQDLQESQSKLINARWIDFVATENESSLSVFRDALTIINLFKWEEISKVVTESSHGMYQAGVALVLDNDVTTFATGKNKHESDERNANKAGRRHQYIYIYIYIYITAPR